jgi:1-pyrroline-5-carboxylate dehydrogenase
MFGLSSETGERGIMSNAYFKTPVPVNEPILPYGPGSVEKTAVKAKISEMKGRSIEIPLIIGGREVKTGNTGPLRVPHDHGVDLGVYHKAGAKEVALAIEAALEARKTWAAMPWEHRVSVILKAADLLAGPWRPVLNAATLLGQSKTIFQAEIDAVCELIDFWRFNSHYLTQLMSEQPQSSAGTWNRMAYRALEGFVFAVTPFNFTSIGGNLPTAPALAGCTALWKPASSAVYASYYIMKLLEEAGLPPGVVNFIPGSGAEVGDPVLESPHLAGIHFTGSTATFQHMWRTVGQNITRMKYYPRIVGETGGKDFIFAHPSADVDALVVAALRGAFEYQGQKCSAASRMYVPRSIWSDFRDKYVAEVGQITMGDPENFTHFMAAVIDEAAFKSITAYIDYAHAADDAECITGGGYDDTKGWFIEPTTIVTTNPRFKTMAEEIFGPVLTIYVYEDDTLDETLTLCDTTSPYALTGAVFAQDRAAIVKISNALQNAAGNFYINDKPTGAVVGQQPFGGGRASGTNDKAGSAMNLMRWMSARTIKETLVPPVDWRYPFMGEK